MPMQEKSIATNQSIRTRSIGFEFLIKRNAKNKARSMVTPIRPDQIHSCDNTEDLLNRSVAGKHVIQTGTP